ncbi:MAG: carbon monoxide dehydrogenase subunit G [Nevskia sp.]|nr:carbon monoxide dehydrogenase subunit G [Nevskia sp.]
MTGQQRIAAPTQRVWEALYDPDILKRCVPGCQSMVKESAERMRAVAEIKIGPIGARFNGMVTLSDIDPPRGYTMTIEGQGGTVGFVKSSTRVRLASEGAEGTLLSYEVDAQIGGRLAQLGGPIIDATAKQLAGRFFQEFGSIVGPPPAAVAAPAQGALPASLPSAATGTVPSRGPSWVWMLALSFSALVGYLVGHAPRGGGESDWMGLSIGLLVMIVAATGFEFGRRSAAPVVMLDPKLLARLVEEARR